MIKIFKTKWQNVLSGDVKNLIKNKKGKRLNGKTHTTQTKTTWFTKKGFTICLGIYKQHKKI